ncbi:3-isopropylmalate dehydratase small subunit [Francisella tularensis]|uniref:3-isopropylmalate dehydratase small subunit n=1 Tax=Francisella tularensis TaxID=263 RepID=UPI0001855510|nr:3-isopropylmalate dehydratase small subunit [Francisella tularensis]APC95487.1 3-isopropylmalate dehydratase, small subunit [Francisella tularensis subsp. novicida]EDZ90356.1 3-isopropylmalate dehydratase, small subunit [Francisella tularensis subsp. novicida FTG]MBK2334722.1 3-isopropylmalate dehydratase small subunit [Francisella tularensis subsp. novicida]MBK2345728.1 3-isopropylmalate dehydratase small subunit [Francisella tularensis subsp. novicida]
MQAFKKLTSSAIPLWLSDIDTDMIIPANFLTQTTKDGYGKSLFYNLKEKDSSFVFNNPDYSNSEILIAGDNFGCGSSREHAVWALTQAGIKVIIAPSFSDIFFNNAAKNGLLLISLDKDTVKELCDKAEDPKFSMTIDLQEQTVSADGSIYSFDYDPFRKDCLIRGLDDMTYLIEHLDIIKQFEQSQRG